MLLKRHTVLPTILVVTLSSEYYYTIIYPRKPIFNLLKMGFLTEKNTVPAKMPERLALLLSNCELVGTGSRHNQRHSFLHTRN